MNNIKKVKLFVLFMAESQLLTEKEIYNNCNAQKVVFTYLFNTLPKAALRNKKEERCDRVLSAAAWSRAWLQPGEGCRSSWGQLQTFWEYEHLGDNH